MSLNLMKDAENSLSSLIGKHKSWAYRSNTIVQAAIIAFDEMPDEMQIDYLKRIHGKDSRYIENCKEAPMESITLFRNKVLQR